MHPPAYQELALGRIPVRFQVCMALLPKPNPCVVAIPALKRHMPGWKKSAQAVFKKCASIFCKLLQRVTVLAAAESGRKHAKGKIGRNFQHHPAAQAVPDHPHGFFNRPPARTDAIPPAYGAGTRPGRRIFFLQGMWLHTNHLPTIDSIGILKTHAAKY